MSFFQTHVGVIIIFWFLARSLDLALSNIETAPGKPRPRWPWIFVYVLLAVLLFIAAMISLGTHV